MKELSRGEFATTIFIEFDTIIEIVFIDGESRDEEGPAWQMPQIAGNTLAFLQYTSGEPGSLEPTVLVISQWQPSAQSDRPGKPHARPVPNP